MENCFENTQEIRDRADSDDISKLWDWSEGKVIDLHPKAFDTPMVESESEEADLAKSLDSFLQPAEKQEESSQGSDLIDDIDELLLVQTEDNIETVEVSTEWSNQDVESKEQDVFDKTNALSEHGSEVEDTASYFQDVEMNELDTDLQVLPNQETIADVTDTSSSWLSELSENAVIVKADDVDMSFAKGLDDENFWNHHGNDKETYLKLAEKVPDVRQALENGRSFEELRQDPVLQDTFVAYFDNQSKQKIEVEQDANGNYYFLDNGRHRLQAAKELGHEIPVYVVNKTEQEWRASDDSDLSINRPLDSTQLENIRAVNPNFNQGSEWQFNCQRCVPTYELRLRGYDVTAQPRLDDNDYLSYNPFGVWENPDVLDTTGTGLVDIQEKMEEWGNGARAQVVVIWENGVDGHTFTAFREDDKTYFIDAQNCQINAEQYFKNVLVGSTQFCRIDNLRFSHHIMDCYKQRRSA